MFTLLCAVSLRLCRVLLCLVSCVLMPLRLASQTSSQVQQEAAQALIRQFMGKAKGLKVEVSIDASMQQDGRDAFAYSMQGRTLHVKASSGVAACRGFYDFVKANGAGICSWSGTRFELPKQLAVSRGEAVSPYRDHQYFNVVTYGYSMPYWDERRWDEEIQWMALHGIDMPLMLVGQEAIYRRVFMQDYGLTAEELDAWEVGPAHLPWFRMGNLSGKQFDGPLGQHWHDRQVALAKHILKRMRELGMKPVCPAFGGFVPGALRQKGVEGIENVGWDWCRDGISANYRLSPSSKEFVAIGRRFIEEWEKEFGVCQYYLSDSFNEMAIPDDLHLLTQYGDNVFRCISEGSRHPHSVWVTQGWTFVYQSGEWGRAKFDALTRNVPRHRFNMLYMSPEYGNGKWDAPYEGFNRHDWTVTMLPNMGGKNFYNGSLQDYASAYRTQYAGSAHCRNLTGWGLTAEGIENNEMLYELICDAGWMSLDTVLDLDEWKQQYARNRYGLCTPDIRNFLDMLQQTELASYRDHKAFGWQGYNKSEGYVSPGILPGEAFLKGMEEFLSAANLRKYEHRLPPLLRVDLIEAAAFYGGCRAEMLNRRIMQEHQSGNDAKARQLVDSLSILLRKTDRLLTAHPLYNEQVWEDKAARMAGGSLDGTVQTADEATRAKYVRNARMLVTVWHGAHGAEPTSHEPVNDYSCRIWAGLIRDYYLPRLLAEWDNILNGSRHNLRSIENDFVNAAQLSDIEGGTLSPRISDRKVIQAIINN